MPGVKGYTYEQKAQRNRMIVRLREEGRTLEAIGKIANISRERVRQICSKAEREKVGMEIRKKNQVELVPTWQISRHQGFQITRIEAIKMIKYLGAIIEGVENL